MPRCQTDGSTSSWQNDSQWHKNRWANAKSLSVFWQSIEMNQKSARLINTEAVRFYLRFIRKHGHFEIALALRNSGASGPDDKVCDQALDSLVAHLLPLSRETFVYHNTRSIVGRADRPPIPKWIAKHPTRLTVDPTRTPIAPLRPFWRWTLLGSHGAACNLVLRIPEAAFPKALIARSSFDPVILTNLRAAVSPRAVSYCKRSVGAAEDVCCAFHRDALGLSLSLFGRYQFLSSLYRQCVKDCSFSGKGLEEELRPKSKKAMVKTLRRMFATSAA